MNLELLFNCCGAARNFSACTGCFGGVPNISRPIILHTQHPSKCTHPMIQQLPTFQSRQIGGTKLIRRDQIMQHCDLLPRPKGTHLKKPLLRWQKNGDFQGILNIVSVSNYIDVKAQIIPECLRGSCQAQQSHLWHLQQLHCQPSPCHHPLYPHSLRGFSAGSCCNQLHVMTISTLRQIASVNAAEFHFLLS